MKKRTAKDQLKKLYGIPPYHGPSNYVRGDGYFARSIYDEFGEEKVKRALNKLMKEYPQYFF